MPNEREFQVGDWVRVIGGDYHYTVEGSVGVVVYVEHDGADVDFKEFGPSCPWVLYNKLFNIKRCHIEKIDPPAHLVGDPRTIAQTGDPRTIAQTQEQIHEILSQKIDSEEKLLECMGELGLSKTLFDIDWWKARDYLRINLKYFKHVTLPGGDCEIAPQDAFLHVSKCKTKAAFYENEDKQKRDICTVMGYGRYLTKYHPELDNEQVKAAVNTFNYDHGVAPEVLFGESQDEFIRAINEGPSESCMSMYSLSNGRVKHWFKGHIHPAAAYAAGDIKVAWLEREGTITARTLINKQTKEFSRVYGDHAKLKPLLEFMGYRSQLAALAGCRLLMIDNENGEGYIMPYVDAGTGPGGGSLSFEEVDGFFVLNDNGDGDDTKLGYDNGGVTNPQEPEYTCDNCGNGCDEDDLTYTHDETSVCEHCLNKYYTLALVGRNHHEYVSDRDTVYVKCIDDHVHSEYLSGLDVVLDEFSEEYIYDRDAVKTLSDLWAKQDDCTDCGTDKYGDTIWLHGTEVRDAAPGLLYKDGGRRYFWHESVEITNWLESAGEEDHDPEAFVLVKKVEPKAAPAASAAEAPKSESPPTTIKVGDMVKVVDNDGYGPVGHVGGVLSITTYSVLVETPGGCVRVPTGSGWYHRHENVELVKKAEPQGRLEELQKIMAGSDINNEPQKPWQAAYLRMQEMGIKFTDEGVSYQNWAFSSAQRGYKIDLTQTPPDDWREIYKEAQASGVKFECFGIGGEWSNIAAHLRFDSHFEHYRLKETA